MTQTLQALHTTSQNFLKLYLYRRLQNSTTIQHIHNYQQLFKQQHTNLNKTWQTCITIYATSQNFTKRFKSLQHYKQKRQNNYTSFFFKKAITIHNLPQLYKLYKPIQTIHNFTKLYTTLLNLKNQTRLYKTIQNHTILYELLQNYTKLYKTIQHNLSKLHTLYEALHNFTNLYTT